MIIRWVRMRVINIVAFVASIIFTVLLIEYGYAFHPELMDRLGSAALGATVAELYIRFIFPVYKRRMK